jgi:hypothetical protein
MSARGTLRRRRIALATAVAWVLAFEVMPWLHIALHDRIGHHHHDANGAVVADDQVDEPEGDHHHDRTPIDDAARIARSLDHGRHSAAHHDVASLPAAIIITSPLPIDRRPITLAVVTSIEPISFSPGRAVARGPPVALS